MNRRRNLSYGIKQLWTADMNHWYPSIDQCRLHFHILGMCVMRWWCFYFFTVSVFVRVDVVDVCQPCSAVLPSAALVHRSFKAYMSVWCLTARVLSVSCHYIHQMRLIMCIKWSTWWWFVRIFTDFSHNTVVNWQVWWFFTCDFHFTHIHTHAHTHTHSYYVYSIYTHTHTYTVSTVFRPPHFLHT